MMMSLLLLALVSSLGGTQTEPARPILAPIVRTERLGAGVVRIVFDVNGEASARFTVILEASNDNGRTFAIRARATSGDVGSGVAAGSGKVIEWDSTKDVDDLQLDQYVFRVLVSPAVPEPAALKIVVLAGQDAVNTIRQSSSPAVARTAVTPVVEVHDRNGLPVSGAAVTFRITGGRTATFGNGAAALDVTTNADGRAAAAGLTPVAAGAVRMTVQASYQGEQAAATIQQVNIVQSSATAGGTAAAGKKGGGLSRGKIAGIVGGVGAVAVGAGIGLTRGQGGATASTSDLTIRTSPTGSGIRDVTIFAFSAAGGRISSPTYAWDFGDGTSLSGPSVMHVYTAEGTFSVTLRASAGNNSETSAATVTVGSVTGTWRTAEGSGGITFSLILVQQGNAPTGTWRMDYGPTCAPTTCPLGPNSTELWPMSAMLTDPRRITVNQLAQCQRTFTAEIAPDLRSMSGSFVNGVASCGPGQSSVTYVRQ